jgi:hypothetical protein
MERNGTAHRLWSIVHHQTLIAYNDTTGARTLSIQENFKQRDDEEGAPLRLADR